MNIFYLHEDPAECAKMHCDKHVVKMCIEYAQLMSTAHRVLDGYQYTVLAKNNRKIKRWGLDNLEVDLSLMKASHINHPSNVWLRASKQNYIWLYNMWVCLLKEYTYRYGRNHACEKYMPYLKLTPMNIPQDAPFFEPAPAMPDDCKVPGDSLQSYHKYYVEKKSSFAKWKNRPIPEWFSYANVSFQMPQM